MTYVRTYIEDETYDPDDVDTVLPQLPVVAPRVARVATPTSYVAASGEPPVALGVDDMELWRGQRAPCKDDGSVNRSEVLKLIACALANAGASRDDVATALADRDVALGLHKND